MTNLLLSVAIFPPIQYFSKLVSDCDITIEKFEHYAKQTYRNRYEIQGPNGRQVLSVPIVAKNSSKTQIKDIRIATHNNWQRIHLKAIETAYRSSPFYEYYIDELSPFFNKKHDFLFDACVESMELLKEMSEAEFVLNYTTDFIVAEKENALDLRTKLSPKTDFGLSDPKFKATNYKQVFDDKHGFLPNLSTLDLIFNEGPNALNCI